MSDFNLRHFLIPTGDTTAKVSKPIEALSTKKFHQNTFVSLLATEKTMIWKKCAADSIHFLGEWRGEKQGLGYEKLSRTDHFNFQTVCILEILPVISKPESQTYSLLW